MASLLPAISSLSLRETQKIVLNFWNFSIYAGTTGGGTIGLPPAVAVDVVETVRSG